MRKWSYRISIILNLVLFVVIGIAYILIDLRHSPERRLGILQEDLTLGIMQTDSVLYSKVNYDLPLDSLQGLGNYYSAEVKPTREEANPTIRSTEKKKRLGFGDLPNEETDYIYIQTQNVDDNLKVLTALEKHLSKQGFDLEVKKPVVSSFDNCDDNTIVALKGAGRRAYYARKKKPLEGYFYPDFILEVYEFSDNKSASEALKHMKNALYSRNYFCNGKDPHRLFQNSNEIYYLSTRAEMFRGYINDSGKVLEEA